MHRFTYFACAILCAAGLLVASASAQNSTALARIAATTAPESLSSLREWDTTVERMLRGGELAVARETEDTLMPGHRHERLTQYYEGVPIFGGDITRQSSDGVTTTVFGTIYSGITLNTTPAITQVDAQAIVERIAGTLLGPSRAPNLIILPKDDGSFVLTYRARVLMMGDMRSYFIDAQSGEVALEYSELDSQAAVVGRARGLLNDTKKISTSTEAGSFVTIDRLRPKTEPFGGLATFDMKGNTNRTINIINGAFGPASSDLGRDTDNDWTDGRISDAHVYAGWVYDYLFKVLGRRGLDNNNIEIWSFVNPVLLEDFPRQPASVRGQFYQNAFYARNGNMVYGVGLPPGVLSSRGQAWANLAGGLDVVAHELGHGVTEFTSNLIYQGESGALNESYSDVLGASVEFYFEEAGNGPQRADWLGGEDVVTPGGLRSLADPRAYGDPDHFSIRFTGTSDNGGVHTNSGIPNNAYYLAVVGGNNRTSGLAVQGVGIANRVQIERVWYRAFGFLLPSNSNFALARVATILAARELYGVGSAPERAVTQAWAAVGVN